MIVCDKCGHGNEDGARFCLGCGGLLPEPSPRPAGQQSTDSAVGCALRQVIVGQECNLTEIGKPHAAPGACPLPLLYLRERFGPLGTALAAHKRLVRLLGWLICLFPILLIPKLALLFVRDKVGTVLVGDLITIAWVGLLLLFFATISVYLLLFAFVGPRSRRGKGWSVAPPGDIAFERAMAEVVGDGAARRDPSRPSASELHQLVDSLLKGDKPAPHPLLLSGQVRRFGGSSAELLEDTWYDFPSGVLRELRGLPFILAGDEQPPIVVAPGAVTVLASYAHEGPPPRTSPPWEERPRSTHRFVLAEGRRVEIVGGGIQAVATLDGLVLNGVAYRDDTQGEAPYRGGALRPALLVSSTPELPLLIRRI
jgi:hypothetical protein